MTDCLDEEVPAHWALLKKQQNNRRGPHNYVFSSQFNPRDFDYKFARQKYGWSVDQLRKRLHRYRAVLDVHAGNWSCQGLRRLD